MRLTRSRPTLPPGMMIPPKPRRRFRLRKQAPQPQAPGLDYLTLARAMQTQPAPGYPTRPLVGARGTYTPGEGAGRDGETRALGLSGAIRSTWYRNRRALYPWAAGTAVITAGAATTGLAALTGHAGAVAALTTLITAVAAVACGVAAVRRLHAWLRPWALTATAAATGWLLYTAWTGINPAGIGAAVLLTNLAGLRWWQWVRQPYPTEDPALVRNHHRDGELTAERLVEDWMTYVGSPGGPAAGASIRNVRPYQHGYSADIEMVRGRQSVADLHTALPRIASGLDVQPEDVILEKHPERAAAWAKARFVTRSPIKDTVWFDRPVYRDGKILLGPYADGVGNAVFTLYVEDGINGGYVLGSRGSGKSRFIESICVTAMAETPTLVVYLDGQYGGSSPLLWRHAHWRGGPKDAAQMARALGRMVRYRSAAYNQHAGLTGFTPTEDLPGVLVVVDECHEIFKHSTQRWARIAREGRKTGVAILAASQVVTRDAFGSDEHSDALRSSLLAGNGIALRTASGTQQNIFPGLSVDLTGLPDIPGFGYTVAAADDGTKRTAPFRARFLIDRRKAEQREAPLPEGVHVAEEWFDAVDELHAMDAGTAAAAGEVYQGRGQAAADDAANLARLLSDTDPAEYERVFDDEPTDTPTDQGEAAAANGHPVAPVLAGAPNPATKPDAAPVTELRPVAPAGMPAAQAQVWCLLATDDGHGNRRDWSTAEIATVLGVTQRHVQNQVRALEDTDHIEPAAGRGRYRLAS